MKEDHTEVSHFQCLVSVYSGEFQFFSILLKQLNEQIATNMAQQKSVIIEELGLI